MLVFHALILYSHLATLKAGVVALALAAIVIRVHGRHLKEMIHSVFFGLLAGLFFVSECGYRSWTHLSLSFMVSFMVSVAVSFWVLRVVIFSTRSWIWGVIEAMIPLR